MRGATGVLVLMLAALSAVGQEAPSQPGPLADETAELQAKINASPGDGVWMEPGMTAPKIVQGVAAVYPDGVQVEDGKGRCVLSMVVDEDGRPRSIHVLRSAGDAFDLAAVHAVRQSTYAAGLKEEKAVAVRMLVRVVFTADRAAAIPVLVQRTYRGEGDTAAADYPPKVISSGPGADFSEEARRKKISGTVLVSLVVSEEGLPTEVKVVRGLGYGLDEKAMESVRQYRFRPAMKEGKPVAQHIQVQVSFNTY